MTDREKKTRVVSYADACLQELYPDVRLDFVKSADEKIEAAMRQIDWKLLEKHVKSDLDRKCVDGIRDLVRDMFASFKSTATCRDADLLNVYYNYEMYSKTSHLPPSPTLSSNEHVQKAKKILEPLTGRGYPKVLPFVSMVFIAGCIGYTGYAAGGYLTRKIMSSPTNDALKPTKPSQKSLQIGGTMNPSKPSQDTSRTNDTVESNKPSPNASQINVDVKPNSTSP